LIQWIHGHYDSNNQKLNKINTVVTLCLTVVLAVSNAVSASPGLEALNYFFSEINTFEAKFGQKVLDESFTEIDDSQGKMWIKRPGLFRWDYELPDAQEIVGDGSKVWIYDVELEQVTVRDQDQTLGRSPALLLAGSGNLEEDFTIEDIGTQGRYDWVNLIPKNEESGFNEIRIGFEDNRLRLLELLDNLGQTTRIVFVDIKENTPIASTTFNFFPPQGVDIIDSSEQ